MTERRSAYRFHRDGRTPRFLLVQNRQTDSARGVDIGVVQRWVEFAYIVSTLRVTFSLYKRGVEDKIRLTLRWLSGEVYCHQPAPCTDNQTYLPGKSLGPCILLLPNSSNLSALP